MFHSEGAFSGFAVDDLDAAHRFYADTLGLRVEVLEGSGFLRLHLASGGSSSCTASRTTSRRRSRC
jgi:catechol 2,3-dioxygenase-like lactoylglutathione lyase family enzyme